MRADFQAAAKGDQDGALTRFQKVQATWAPKLAKAVAATGVDPKQGSKEARAVLGEDVPADLPATVATDRVGLVGYSAKFPSTAPSAAEEAQPRLIASTLTIPKPYTLGSTKSGATADRNTGRLFSNNHVEVGNQQQLASVGGTFVADAAVRRIRVETIVDASFFNVVGAIIGYASAEVILNLKVLDGATVRGSQRLSLLRTISAVFWVSSDSGSGAYTLACEFDHAYGTQRTYAALVELETWAGGGGLFVVSPATAYGDATPRNVTVSLMR